MYIVLIESCMCIFFVLNNYTWASSYVGKQELETEHYTLVHIKIICVSLVYREINCNWCNGVQMRMFFVHREIKCALLCCMGRSNMCKLCCIIGGSNTINFGSMGDQMHVNLVLREIKFTLTMMQCIGRSNVS